MYNQSPPPPPPPPPPPAKADGAKPGGAFQPKGTQPTWYTTPTRQRRQMRRAMEKIERRLDNHDGWVEAAHATNVLTVQTSQLACATANQVRVLTLRPPPPPPQPAPATQPPHLRIIHHMFSHY